MGRTARRLVVFAVFLLIVAGLYETYKAAGEALDDSQTDWWFIGSFLPRTDDITMPHIVAIFGEFGEAPREGGESIGSQVFKGSLFTLREAVVGFAAGVVIGLGIAIGLARSEWAERAVLPYVIASQTIPLVAIAPIIVIWGRNNFDFLPWEWQDWYSVSLIAVYLTFFPVAVNGLRGLKSPSPASLELMDSYAATWRQTLWRVRLPASVPYLFTGFKIAATASVVGAIVGEISSGVRGGVGRLILDFAGRYAVGPERLYVSVIGAGLLGLFAFLVVLGAERYVLSRRGQAAV